MNPAVDFGRDHRYDRVPQFTCRNGNVRCDEKRGRGRHSKTLGARLRIAACTSCFPFEPTERRVLSTSLLRTIKRESKRPLVHRGVTATIARHGDLHFASLSPQEPSSIPPANFRSNLLGRRLRRTMPRKSSVMPFLLRGRNGYFNLSIFCQSPCPLRITITLTISLLFDRRR